jgi:alkylation response protein AidB-like acyl-CoA dehydrogenase
MAVLTEEQTMLRDMAREWGDNESPVTAFRRLRNAAPAEGFDVNAWGEMGQMGWGGIVVPEAHGGSELGYLSLGMVIEQLGRTLVVDPQEHSTAAEINGMEKPCMKVAFTAIIARKSAMQ